MNLQTQSLTARDISARMLEVTRVAYVARDFEAFATHFHFPQKVGSFDGDRTLTSQADLRPIFERMCDVFDRSDVTDLHRTVLEAEFRGPHTVESTFVSKFVYGSGRIGEETYAHGVLRCFDGTWKIAESRYASAYREVTEALHARD